jgi:ribosome recycling factor
MPYDFTHLKQKIEEIKAWLVKEYASIRTGRATPIFLDNITVEAYGSKMPIKQLANITVEDARTLRIVPWDTSHIKNIEKAITSANLGVTVGVDERGIRVSFPELTTERRAALLKAAKGKLEQTRISLRTERDRAWSDIQNKERAGDISEDDKFRLKDEMQKIIDEANKALEELAERKEAEISR